MINFLDLFVILIGFHPLSGRPNVTVFQDDLDVNDGSQRDLLKIFVTIMMPQKRDFSRFSSGILFIGGHSLTAAHSVEFWSAADPFEGGCMLKEYPRWMGEGPTADLVSGQLVACYGPMCEVYNGRDWDHLVATRQTRFYHSSAVKEERILLIGGLSRDTEWIPVDGSPSQPGPFEVRHGKNHCTVQMSADTIVVTGGFESEEYVTEYQLTGDGNETPLTSMRSGGRSHHACAAYMQAGGKQVIKKSMRARIEKSISIICYLLSYKCLDASYHRGHGLARLSLEY